MNTQVLKNRLSKTVIASIVLAFLGALLLSFARPMKAKAATVPVYHDPGAGYMISVCKFSTAYGYILRTYANKPAYTINNASIQTFVYAPNGSFAGSKSSNAWLGSNITPGWPGSGGTLAWVDIAAGGDFHSFDAILSINTSPSNIMKSSRVLMYYVPYC